MCAILGGSLSSNALAEEATAAQLKIPFVCDNAAATEITGTNCNHYTFRLNTPVLGAGGDVRARTSWATARSGISSPPPTPSARTSPSRSRSILKQAGGTIVGDDRCR